MKKIGILFGKERSFPEAFIRKVNSMEDPEFQAEAVQIDKVIQGQDSGYAVIIDRISQDVPFYRAFLKNAALCGTAVINNPFWESADEKFFNNCLATRIGVPVPRTVILPSRELPEDTANESFSNLAYPLDWDHIFSYISFPAYMKPFAGGGWKNVYKVADREDFFLKHHGTGQLVMLLQEEISFDQYYRCYCIGSKYVRIMPYEPRNPHHLRYQADFIPDPALHAALEQHVVRLNRYLGYDFNTVEFAVRDGIPYAIDFCNPAPDADPLSVGQENFQWVVDKAADYALERARMANPGADNLTWGKYIRDGVRDKPSAADAAKSRPHGPKPRGSSPGGTSRPASPSPKPGKPSSLRPNPPEKP